MSPAASTGDAAPGTAPFVGRSTEMAALCKSLERARSGRGQVLLLAGDGGMGKTRSAQELARHAEAQGMLALWGRCSEEPGAPPFWPWTQAIRALAAQLDDDALRDVLGAGAAQVLGLVPELGPRLGSAPAAELPEDEPRRRFRLFDALAQLWLRVAQRQPLLLVLDNLHGADPTSLRLLVFLAEELIDAPLCLLGTYRGSELARGHPMSAAIADLARVPQFAQLQLGGLDRDATERCIAQMLGMAPDDALLDQLHQRTDGVPLFLVETLRDLRVGRAADATASGLARRQIPATIREVIGRRLARLSPACCRVLDIAAVVGRDFGGELLAALDPISSDDALLGALEEAQAAHVIQALAAEQYQFTHALMRETLYDALLPARRARLHLKIATLLEARRAAASEASLPQLAYHFGAALPAGPARKALEYACRAAERAMALLAFEEAARQFGQALSVHEQHFAGDRAARSALLLANATAQHRAGQVDGSLALFHAAAKLARELGSDAESSEASLGIVDVRPDKRCADLRSRYFSRAALGYEDAGWRAFHSGIDAVALLEEALQLAPDDDEPLRARLESALCRACVYGNQPQRFDAAYRRAIVLARRVGDPFVLFKALAAMAPTRIWPAAFQARRSAAAEARALAESAGRPDWFVDDIAYFHFGDLVEAGDLAAARTLTERFEPVVEAMRQPFLLTMNLSCRTLLAIHEGRFAEAETLAGQAFASGRRAVSGGHAQGVYGLQMFTIRRDQGRLGEVLPVLRHLVAAQSDATTWLPGLALLYAELGMHDEARGVFERLAADGFSAVLRATQAVTESTFLAEVCTALGDVARAPPLYRALLPYAARNLVGGNNVVCFGAADRRLGALAALMRQADQARRHFEIALATDGNDGERPQLAYTQYAFALNLLGERDGEQPRAKALLEQAHAIARRFGMSALEGRCRAELDVLPVPRAELPDGLSEREVEVLRLVAAGRSNKQIGERMFISPFTVANHVRHIFGKIGVANRTEAAAYAMRHRLVQP